MQLKFSLIPRQDETSLCNNIPLVICPLAISIGRRHIGIEEKLHYILNASIV